MFFLGLPYGTIKTMEHIQQLLEILTLKLQTESLMQVLLVQIKKVNQ